MTMKKILIPLVLLVSMLSACSDDAEKNISNPIQVGDEIQFGSALPSDVQSRTIYGDDVIEEAGKKYFPIYWENQDQIAIFSSQASRPVEKWAKYEVSVSDKTSSVATTIKRLGDCGLQWGKDAVHHFHGIYPASLIQSGSNWQNGLKVVLPETQHATVEYNVKPGVHVARPDMNNALMYAYNPFNRLDAAEGTAVPLNFKPLASVIDITVNGPNKANVDNNQLVINGIQVIATKEGATRRPKIAGEFSLKFADHADGITCTVPQTDVTSAANTNKVNISLGTEGVILKKGEKLQAKAFLIPDAKELEGCTFQIRVSVSRGGLTKVKTYKDMVVQPGKITRVNLPFINNEIDVNYWMTGLNPNIYLTEISVPGSKMSFLSPQNKPQIAFQEADIQSQFKAGIRAFILQTHLIRTGILGNYENELFVCSNGKSVMPLKEAIKNISSYLKTAAQAGKREYAFVMLTYSESGSKDGIYWNNEVKNATQAECWMATLHDELSVMQKNATLYSIYPDEVSPETTLGDVANQIVVKVNTNVRKNMFRFWDEKKVVPMLHSEWDGIIEGDKPLTWGHSNSAQSKLRWVYQEVTTVEDVQGKTKAEATLSTKIQKMENVFNRSLNEYASNNNHNIWYMNDLGGYQIEVNKDSASLVLAKNMNAHAIQVLNNRNKNASLGLVFLNFADRGPKAQSCRSDFLIQTIIDNNFKFDLRMK